MPLSDTWRLGWLGGYSHSTLGMNARRASASSDNYHLGSTTFALDHAPATARLTLGWKHSLGNTTPKTSNALEGSDRFAVFGAPVARNAALLATGQDIQLAPLSS